MNNYLICAWDKHFNCSVRTFETFNEYQNAIRYLDDYIDLSFISGYNPQHMLIFHKSYNEGRC